MTARLLGAEKALANNPSQRLIDLHKLLSGEMEKILDLEEELWGMKARINWLIQGERNTAFFHITALTRRSRNRIAGINDPNGNWIVDIDRVKEIFLKGFKKLYSSEQVWCERTLQSPLPFGNSLSDSEALNLSLLPSDAEILFALNSMKAFKAPGPDGLHAGFFQRFWLVVGNSVKLEVKKIFQTKKVPPWLNRTLIALIPKKLGPETISHFRPINLCNTLYKVVSKILVLRLKHLMPRLVSPSQSAFVAGRRGTDNVIVAQELLFAMERMKGRTGNMIIKIDLEKAYDRLEWGFVRKMLTSLNFHMDTVELILSCISSTSISLLFNGEQLEEFQPSRGLRQGDPLSPYIFILCMEYLSSLINRKCDDGVWGRVKASRNGPGFSHIFFTDDLLLFAKAT